MTKNILILGGSSGIGYGLVTKFLANNFKVIAVGRNTSELKVISSTNSNLHVLKADITSAASKQSILDTLSGINALGIINNAAYGYPTPFKSTSIAEIRQHYETNVFAPLEIIQSIFNSYQVTQVLNISSGAAEFPLQSLLSYRTSKAAIHHAMKCLALEYPHAKFANLRPGMVDTPLQEKWRNFESSVFPKGNFYKEAYYKNQLLSIDKVANFVYHVWNNPDFAKDWNINSDDK